MASTKVYVGNLSWNTTDDTLRKAFSDYGQVVDSIVMRDRDTGRSRGFGFVTFSSESEATGAISALNEQEFEGRRIKVNFANARPQQNQGGGQGGGYGGGGMGGGGGYNPAAGGYNVGGGYGGGYNAGAGFGGGYGGYPQQGFGGGYPQQGGGGY
ncbi:hypothetical protein ACEPAG_8216 [Sanghuangporus baumii]